MSERAALAGGPFLCASYEGEIVSNELSMLCIIIAKCVRNMDVSLGFSKNYELFLK